MATASRKSLPPDLSNLQPGDLLTAQDAAALARCAVATLNNLRSLKKGPPYLKVGGSMVRYPRAAFLAWLADDAGKGAAA